jgi:hypothetical protein
MITRHTKAAADVEEELGEAENGDVIVDRKSSYQ